MTWAEDRAHVWYVPTPTAVMLVREGTMEAPNHCEPVVLAYPRPSSPYVFSPQHDTVPTASTAHVWAYPADIATAPVATGNVGMEVTHEQLVLLEYPRFS